MGMGTSNRYGRGAEIRVGGKEEKWHKGKVEIGKGEILEMGGRGLGERRECPAVGMVSYWDY